MSANSMRKSAKGFSREHRERHQPEARAKKGLLEKKKDYKKRAINYHSKMSRLKTLSEKAALKNPDEFYTRMERARVRDGKYRERAAEELGAKYSAQQLRVMKAQDEAYIAYKHAIEQKRRARLQADLHLLQEGAVPGAKPKHTVFVDEDEERAAFDAEEYFDTPAELLARTYNRPTRAQLEEGALSTAISARQAAQQATQRSLAYKELTQRTQRAHAMEEALSQLHVQRQLMTKAGGGARKKVVEGKRPVYRFQRERLK